MKLKELIDGVEIAGMRNVADDNLEIREPCSDSRRVMAGDAFFALPGTVVDGFGFIGQAIDAGAALIVAERDPGFGIPTLLTSDARRALAIAAANFYGKPTKDLRMIGVTGTNGKTTVTHILKGLLDRLTGLPAGLIGTNAVVIGGHSHPAWRTTPDALSLQALLGNMVEAGCGHCVMEVSSHALMQHRTWGIQFAQALFTNLTQDHLDYHRDMEDYFAAKSRLFSQTDAGILNIDDEYGRRLARLPALNAVTYSALRDHADVTAKNIKLKATRVEFEAVTHSEIARIEWATPGAYSVNNALAAVTAALVEGFPLKDIAAAIREIPPVVGRMEVVPGPRDVTVIIDYAHTPDALVNVLSAVKDHAGRIITLFGCGGDRDRTKRPLMAQAAARGSHLIIVTSDNPRTEDPDSIIEEILTGITKNAPPVIVEPDRVKAIGRALREAMPGDIILLCGKGHETYQEIGGVRRPLDERLVVSRMISSEGEKCEPCVI